MSGLSQENKIKCNEAELQKVPPSKKPDFLLGGLAAQTHSDGISRSSRS